MTRTRMTTATQETFDFAPPGPDFDVCTHNACITIHNPNTGNHRTFKIRTQKEDADFAPGKRIIYLLTGADRSDYRNWKSFGFVYEDNGVAVWHKHVGTVYATYADMLNRREVYERSHNVEYMVEARCRICNRPLTEPESISSGVGPICRRK